MRWTSRARFLFLAPAVVWVLAFTVFPLGYSLYIAFLKIESKTEITRERIPMFDKEGDPVMLANGKQRMRTVIHKERVSTTTFEGLKNFRRIFNDPQVGTSVRITLTFILSSVSIELVLGFLLAVLFNRHLAGRAAMRAIMILPIFATPLAAGYLFFTILYEEGGPLGFLGFPFLSDPDWALASVIFVDIWQWTPFCFLVFLAALQSVPDELYEAAVVDGANGWQLLRMVLLPVLGNTIVIVLLLRLAEALKIFDIPFALTGGGPGIATQSYSFLAFRTGIRFFDLGYASALCYGLLITVMIIIMLTFRRLRETYG